MKVRCICGAEVELAEETATAKSICVNCGRVFSALNTEPFHHLSLEQPDGAPYDWLGITPEHCPPDHYTLLSLRPWEDQKAAIDRAARRRLEELAPLLEDPATKDKAAQLKAEVEHAAAVLSNADRRELYVREEKARRSKIVRSWVDEAVRAGPLDTRAIEQLCRRAEALGLRRSLCLQHLQGRGVDVSVGLPKSSTAFRVALAALLVLACLVALFFVLRQLGWLPSPS